MDVLFNSIDVRDLLSSHDLDDSSPLSAPDLRLLIDRLQVRSLHIKSQVRDYIMSHRHDFEEIFSACSISVSKSSEALKSVSELLCFLSEPPVDLQIRDTINELVVSMRQETETRELLNLVTIISELIQRLISVREEVSAGRLMIAAKMMMDLRKAVRVYEVEENEPVVYGLLRKEWELIFEEIQELLTSFMANAIEFEKEHNRLRVRHHLNQKRIGKADLYTVFEAMDVVGILDYELAKLADMMTEYVFKPALNYSSPVSFSQEQDESSEHLTEILLNIVPSVEHKIEELDFEAFYSNIIWVIRFMYNYIFLQNSSWLQRFGRVAWPRISELIIANDLSKVIPDDASKPVDFQKIMKKTSEFESILREMMFISPSDNGGEQLSSFAENLEVHFASRKKTEILARTRKLLLCCDFGLPQEYLKKYPESNNDELVGNSCVRVAEMLFSSERLSVSEAALQLMEIVHHTLQDVCLFSSRVALEFYHAARDVLLLYEAVIPVKVERQLGNINHVAAIVHNDCLYLSQEILGLTFEYGPSFPALVREYIIFADLAPRFQIMAEEILHGQIQLVIFNLKEALDGADGFQNTDLIQQYESAKFSIDQVVFIVEKVRIIWEPLLLPCTYKTSMCMILESVFSRISNDILQLDDMGADETFQLQKLIQSVVGSMSCILNPFIDLKQETKLEDNDYGNAADGVVLSLRKIQKLGDMLDMALKSITEEWECGELMKCGFTKAEVDGFVKSTFTDTPLRRECLRRIQKSHNKINR